MPFSNEIFKIQECSAEKTHKKSKILTLKGNKKQDVLVNFRYNIDINKDDNDRGDKNNILMHI